MRQITLDGREVDDVRPPRPLTDRQREVMRYIVAKETPVRPLEIGALMHAGRPELKPPYFSSDGCAALERLERRGLVRKIARGRYIARTHPENWTEDIR